MKRVPTRELLDDDAGTVTEVEGSLQDLRFVNRWFGGIATGRALVEKVALATGSKQLSILEVASGSSQVPEKIAAALRRQNVQLDVTLLDRSPSHLRLKTRSIAGNALAL